jgi:hypothetical protein
VVPRARVALGSDLDFPRFASFTPQSWKIEI